MNGRLLAIDVGNTQTTLGLFDNETLLDRWRLATRVVRTANELWVLYSQFFKASGYPVDTIQSISIASVVPEQTDAQAKAALRFGIEPLIITDRNMKILRVDYDPPGSVGADRLCGAAAAFAQYGGPVIVVDMGTATVFDVVSADAVYLGGLIAPGVSTAMESLHRSAALLPRVELEFPRSIIGKTTESAIQSGILLGAVAMVDGIVTRIHEELKCDPCVVATGGFSKLLFHHSAVIQHIEPDLVLQGIRIITEKQ